MKVEFWKTTNHIRGHERIEKSKIEGKWEK